jgi:hypothetical protein
MERSSEVDTNQVTADATVALAVVGALAFISNVVIAVFTLKAARATRSAAKATQTAAEATERSAAATEIAAAATRDEADATRAEADATRQTVTEIQIDRGLSWRPYLVSGRNAGNVATVAVQNIGRGPALRLIYCEKTQGSVWLMSTQRRAIGAGAPATNVQVRELPNPPPVYLSSDIALMCNDQFGNWLRFDPTKGEPDVCLRDSTIRPSWVNWFEGLLSPG